MHRKFTEDFGTDPDPHPDTPVRGTDPRIRIRTKMSQIRITDEEYARFSRNVPAFHTI
jgi:hypothetical protein